MIIIKYENESEVEAIVAEQTSKGFHLIEVSNITEGNFLGFDDKVEVIPSIQPTNQEVMDMQITVLDLVVTVIENQMGGM